jgi:hypothetical protein
MRDQLLALGWVEKNGVLVRYSHPRLGWKHDGTLIIGYWEYKEKVTTIEQLNYIIKNKEELLWES